MVISLIEGWALPYDEEWAAREASLWAAFQKNARCYTTLMFKDSTGVGLFCEDCVVKFPGPWIVEAEHHLLFSHITPILWFCERCGIALVKVKWEKCSRCITGFRLYLVADRQHNYDSNNRLRARETTQAASVEPLSSSSNHLQAAEPSTSNSSKRNDVQESIVAASQNNTIQPSVVGAVEGDADQPK